MIVAVAGLNKVGEYSNNVKSLMGRLLENNDYDITVSIIPEPTNPYDKLALLVKANGMDIGYVSKRYQSELVELRPEMFKQDTEARIASWGQADEGFYYCNLELV